MTPPLFIFDFDGTLADTLELFIGAYNDLAPRFHLETVTSELRRELQRIPVREVINRMHVRLWKIPFLAFGIQRRMRKARRSIRLFPGIPDLLTALQERKITAGVLSSNRVDTISLVMEQEGAAKTFAFIRSERNHLRKDRSLRRIMEDFPGYAAYYVGDQESDMRAAQRAGLKCIGVTWGFNSADMLKKASPDYIAATPSELMELCLSLSSSQ